MIAFNFEWFLQCSAKRYDSKQEGNHYGEIRHFTLDYRTGTLSLGICQRKWVYIWFSETDYSFVCGNKD